jgi:hypothetical protein
MKCLWSYINAEVKEVSEEVKISKMTKYEVKKGIRKCIIVNVGLQMWDTRHEDFAGLEHVGLPITTPTSL